MTLDQSQVSHTGFKGSSNTRNIITTIKDTHLIFTRVTLLMKTKTAQEKVPFHIFRIQLQKNKIKSKDKYITYGRFFWSKIKFKTPRNRFRG